MSRVMATDVLGRSNNVIGKIFSENSLESSSSEIVTLEFSTDFNGIESNAYGDGGAVLTFIKSMGSGDRDIVSPIVMLNAPNYDFPISVLASGIITKTIPPTAKRRPNDNLKGTCTVMIILPGKKPETVQEWWFKLPEGMRLDRKIVYIKKFNIYIGGCSTEQMEEIRDSKVFVASSAGAPKSLVDIHVRGNVPGVNTLYFSFNGIFGRVNVEPTVEPITRVTLRVGESILTETILNKDILNMETSIYKLWDKFGGVELLIDVDNDRLSRVYDQLRLTDGKIPPDAVALLNSIKSENLTLRNKLNEKDADFKDMVRDKERIIRDKEQIISDQKVKIGDAEHELKIQQEEFKTKREEIRYHGSVADKSHSAVMETIKLVGAIFGGVSLFITLVSKFWPTSTKNVKGVVEWSFPVLFKRGAFKIIQIMNPIIGIGVLAVSACIGIGWFFHKIFSNTNRIVYE